MGIEGIPDRASWGEATATELRKVATSVADAPTPEHLGEKRLPFSTIRDDADAAIFDLTSSIGRDRCIYVITLDEDADLEAVKAAYDEAKQRSDLKLPQDNGGLSATLYVGSSCATKKRTATFRSRLRQHLIKAPKGTYALSLAEWASGLRGGLVINAWQYPSAGEGLEGDETARRVVLAVEDWLSGQLKPVLGRRGSRH